MSKKLKQMKGSKKQRLFTDFYTLSNKMLGKGAYGEVVLGFKAGDISDKYAVKIMDKTNMNKSDMVKLHKEVNILQTLNHPNVVRVSDFFDEPDRFLIVMEYVDGGELFKKIVEDEYQFTEAETREVIRTLAAALKHCKDRGVIHRDIKPENILLTSSGEIKLVDFNLSKKIDKDELEFNVLQTMCGTPNYVAPEVISGKPYAYKCDIWSLGVIAFLLLSGGYLPFFINPNSEGKDELLAKVRAARWRFSPEKSWMGVSDQAKDLVSHMLVKNPQRRFDYERLIAHPWFKRNKPDLQNNIIDTKKMITLNEKRRLLSASKVKTAVDAFKEMMGAPDAKIEGVNSNFYESKKENFNKPTVQESGNLFNDELP